VNVLAASILASVAVVVGRVYVCPVVPVNMIVAALNVQPFIVLFVSASVEARPTKVSGVAGKVYVFTPEPAIVMSAPVTVSFLAVVPPDTS